MKIINPNRLKLGDTISFISPSAGLAPFAMHRIDNAVKSFNRMGFKVKIERNALKNHGYISAPIKQRVADIHSAFKDKKVKAIICTIGGNHSNQLLRLLNYSLIKNNPKVFIGYSDITVLHHAIFKKSGLRTFYGPCVMPEFGEYPDVYEYTKQSFFQILVYGKFGEIQPSMRWTDQFLNWTDEENHFKKRVNKYNTGYEWWRGGKTNGNLFGGAIPSINHLAGTEFFINYKNKILFIDLPEGNNPGEGISISDVDANLADLYNMNIFKVIKGLIIGRAYAQDEVNFKKIKKAILWYTKSTRYPILYNVDIGHTSPMLTLPFGIHIIMDSKRNIFQITERSVQ